MSKVLTTGGRVAMAEATAALSFVAALSRGDPAWDAAWDQPNPPQPGIDATDVVDLIGYFRPTIVDFAQADEDGQIHTDEDGRFSLADGPTRYLRIRVSIPPGTLGTESVREVGIFAGTVFGENTPNGRTVMEPGDVVAPGTLMQAVWSRPQPFDAGTAYARNFILRV